MVHHLSRLIGWERRTTVDRYQRKSTYIYIPSIFHFVEHTHIQLLYSSSTSTPTPPYPFSLPDHHNLCLLPCTHISLAPHPLYVSSTNLYSLSIAHHISAIHSHLIYQYSKTQVLFHAIHILHVTSHMVMRILLEQYKTLKL